MFVKRKKLQVIDGETLMDLRLEPTRFCVDTLLPQGVCMLSGATKIGKSWMVLDWCVHIAKGEMCIRDRSFTGREEAILWICTHNALREDLTEEQRRYLIGRRYQTERALHGESPASSPAGLESCWKTSTRLGREYGSTPTTIQRYGVFAAAMDTIGKYAPLLFEQILAGKTQLTFAHMIALAEKKPREIKQLEDNLVRSSALQNSLRKTRGRSHPPMTRGFQPTPPPPIKSMPAYDPDGEITSLTLTIPSWIHSMERTFAAAHWEETSPGAKRKLGEALSLLSQKIQELKTRAQEEEHAGA